ncbi:MAG: hypothetical protein LW855_07355 [Alphaproteobacteria bacterium]|jgi:hypothetical protein|nr:hypothetical protein [Thalassospira sp.]MCE2965593.1 hypothetical protein [Alphaproteobacteria bacterium]
MTHHTISLPSHLEGHIAALAADRGVSFDAALTGALEAFFGFAELDKNLIHSDSINALQKEMDDRLMRINSGVDRWVSGAEAEALMTEKFG